MKKKWTVFYLNEAVSGLCDSEIEYDNYAFTLCQDKTFPTKKKCKKFIKNKILDYNKRKIKNYRFIILPVYCLKEDNIFTKK